MSRKLENVFLNVAFFILTVVPPMLILAARYL